ncbi:unnamed protein product [Anisakis simplex]|uniref:Transposase n=1 Tax=Anisakis simplex TaxID=6269 RepID=A0A0M3JNT8_ANISI|nr:unnamed protein product [Anisakis simplex]
MKERQSLDAIKKVKISAEKLDKQGILLSVDGYTTFKEFVLIVILLVKSSLSSVCFLLFQLKIGKYAAGQSRKA